MSRRYPEIHASTQPDKPEFVWERRPNPAIEGCGFSRAGSNGDLRQPCNEWLPQTCRAWADGAVASWTGEGPKRNSGRQPDLAELDDAK